MSPARRFDFAFAPAYRRAARVFGITPARAWVEIGESTLDARFGPWRVCTPLSNITAVEVTGPYAFIKTAGSARLGVTDLGLTFATNGDRGVLLTFATKITGMDRFGVMRHPELTVTVADIDGFVGALESARSSFPSRRADSNR